MRLGSQLPSLYETLLPSSFLSLDGSEKTANCSSCYMRRLEEQKPFLASTKCCTYYPFVPNYLVGGMLAENGEAAERMKQLIRHRQWALPIGVVAPPSYQVKHQNKHKDDFGRQADLVCPFYKAQTGHCGIWQWRDSQCSTYFCTYDDPKKGPDFWSEVQQFLYEVEMLLSQECMIHKGYAPHEIESNLKWVRFSEGETKTKPYSLSALDWSALWQHHHDEIELYYLECYKLVSSSKTEFKKDIKEIHQKYEWNRPTSAKLT